MVLRKLSFTLALAAAVMLSSVQAGHANGARDIRVVVDISGSMKLNDPDNLRRPAVRLLAGLLPDGIGVGLWTFGREVNMLVPHAPLDGNQRQALIDGSRKINSVAQRTNIGAAIEKASDAWYAPGRSPANTHLILLSDGKVDIDPSPAPNNPERERILGELVPALAARGLTIHTIALSAEADLDLLGAIADHTGGVARIAASADDLSRIFADLLGHAVAANEIPLADNRFAVDSGVEEFTALIFSTATPDDRELTLVHPDGSRTSFDQAQAQTQTQARWAREAGYDLVTVPQPAAGEWRLEGTLGEGSRVTVVSDLRLAVNPIAPRFLPGEAPRLEAFFTEGDQRLTDPDFLGVVTLRLTLISEDGRRGTRVLNGDQPPADGIYRDSFDGLQEPGQYQLELQADGGTFSRMFRQTLTLVAPPGDGPAATAGAEQSMAEPAPEPVTAVDDPIDLSLVEEASPPAPVATDPPAEVSPEPERPVLWPWLAGGAGLLLVLVLLALILWRRRLPAAPVTDTISGEKTPANRPDSTPTSAQTDPQGPTTNTPDPETEGGAREPIVPVADTLPDDLEDSLPEDDGSAEFGLEDFDLSDIDHLPDLDAGEDSKPRQTPSREGDDPVRDEQG